MLWRSGSAWARRGCRGISPHPPAAHANVVARACWRQAPNVVTRDRRDRMVCWTLGRRLRDSAMAQRHAVTAQVQAEGGTITITFAVSCWEAEKEFQYITSGTIEIRDVEGDAGERRAGCRVSYKLSFRRSMILALLLCFGFLGGFLFSSGEAPLALLVVGTIFFLVIHGLGFVSSVWQFDRFLQRRAWQVRHRFAFADGIHVDRSIRARNAAMRTHTAVHVVAPPSIWIASHSGTPVPVAALRPWSAPH